MNEETDVLVVLTIHYIKEAEQLCDRVTIVDTGEIIAIDSPTTLKSSLNGYVVLLNVEGLVADLHTHLDGCSWVARYATTDIVVRITVEHGDTRIIDLVRLANVPACRSRPSASISQTSKPFSSR